MNGIVNRIFKSWKTTLIGVVIILGALAAVFADKASLTEAGAFIGVGITLFFINDKGNNPPPTS